MTDITQLVAVQTHDAPHPEAFTREGVGWLPWLEPKPEAELTERHFAAAIDRNRLKSDYFRLLVRDPEILAARTRTDNDIFYNIAEGLPRAERELAAGMVFHLVPGIYLPGRMAVVISETVAVTAGGVDRITDFPQQIFVV